MQRILRNRLASVNAAIVCLASVSIFAGIAGAQNLPGPTPRPAAPRPTAPRPAAEVEPPHVAKPIDLTFVPQDAVAAVVVQPRRILTGPLGSILTPAVMEPASKQHLGFDLKELDQAMIVIGAPEPNPAGVPGEPRTGIVLRFSGPANLQEAMQAVVANGMEADVVGKKARLNSNQREMSAAIIDSTTLAIAKQNDLTWVLQIKAGDSPLRKLLAAGNDAPEFQTIVAIEPLRPIMAPSIAQATQKLPPQMVSLGNLPNLMNSITTTAMVTPQAGVQVQIVAASPNTAAAQELTADVKQLLQIGESMAMAQVNAQPNQKGMSIKPMADKVVQALQPAQNGQNVEIKVDVPGGPAGIGMAAAMILPAVQAARETAARNAGQNNNGQNNNGQNNNDPNNNGNAQH